MKVTQKLCGTMGWASASELVQSLVNAIYDRVEDPNVRKYLYWTIYEEFTNSDWDTVDEVETNDRCWYAILCQQDIHVRTEEAGDDYVCIDCARLVEW